MILFLGTRPGKTSEKLLTGVSCPYCGQDASLSYHSTPYYFHLFWLPLFRVSTARFVECSYCRKGFYPSEFSPGMEEALKED